VRALLLTVSLASAVALGNAQSPDRDWLSWSAQRAEAIGKAGYARGRVGGFFDTRVLKTDRAYNYKLAATWLSRDVIGATARTLQLAERLSDQEVRALVDSAEAVGGTVVMVEIDPREGSGVIPADWLALLRPVLQNGVEGKSVRGTNTPRLRDVKALSGVLRRNYDYDRFWVVFPNAHEDGAPLISAEATGVELVVRISGQEGRVRWPLPVLPQ
jgi:hypothetical protein